MFSNRKRSFFTLLIPGIIGMLLGSFMGGLAAPPSPVAVAEVSPASTLRISVGSGEPPTPTPTSTRTSTPTLPLRPTAETTPLAEITREPAAELAEAKLSDAQTIEVAAVDQVIDRWTDWSGRAIEPAAAPEAPFIEPAGCVAPEDDYLRMWISGHALSRRTYGMLAAAAEMFAGPLGIYGLTIIQGGYDRSDPGGLGIYTGGGVVDLAVAGPGVLGVEYNQVDHLVQSLRAAGFAAWYREPGALYEGSPPHVHAVAIGDRRISAGAAAELTGPNGYFRGYNGLPGPDGAPEPDLHGAPVLCDWMRQMGYTDLRQDVVPAALNWSANDWEARLRMVADAYVTTSMAESNAVARQIDFLEDDSEHAANMCGPLAVSILLDAGLMPEHGAAAVGPGMDPASYWLANPRLTNRPWDFFPIQDYTLTKVREPVSHYNFDADPLLPGDFLYLYAVNNGYDHMIVVTEVDPSGRAYTVTNNRQKDGSYLIERLLLYDPQDSTAGVFKDEWVLYPEIGQTGLGGFDRLRRNGLTLPTGSKYIAQAEPGDTIYTLAARYNSRVSDILTLNEGIDAHPLMVGQAVSIPANLASPDASSPGKVLASPAGGVVPAVYRPASSHSLPPEDAGAVAAEPPTPLARQVDAHSSAMPSGDWVIYVEDLATGQTVAQFDDMIVHPASTIKIAVAAAFFNWFEEQQGLTLSNGPVQGERSYEQLLKAMLIRSEEVATEKLVDFLNKQPGYEVDPLLKTWGLSDTTVRPRRTTARDIAHLLRRLYFGELLDPASTELLFEILKTPSKGDDERIGAGLPAWVRADLAHKPGTVFDDGWGVVGDVGILDLPEGPLLIVIIGNYVDWVDYDQVQAGIAEIAAAAYNDHLSQTALPYLHSSGQAAGFAGPRRAGSGQFALPLME